MKALAKFLYTKKRWGILCLKVCACSVTQLCPTLCDPMDCSLPGSSVHGDFPGKNAGVVAISSSRGASPPREGWNPCLSCLLHWQAESFQLSHQRSPAPPNQLDINFKKKEKASTVGCLPTTQLTLWPVGLQT